MIGYISMLATGILIGWFVNRPSGIWICAREVRVLWNAYNWLENHMDGTPLSGHGDKVPQSIVRCMSVAMRRIDSSGRYRSGY